MGVELPDDKEYVRSEVAKLKKEFRNKCFFFQLGIINEIVNFENIANKSEEFKEDMKIMRIWLQNILHSDYGILPAFRENMPTTEIVYDVTKSDEMLLKETNAGCKKRIKKAISTWLEFRLVQEDQYEIFFAKRQETAGTKWFNTISKQQYHDLLNYMSDGKWALVGAFLEGEMVAGGIYLFDGKFAICPYGFFDRKYNKFGCQHFLKFKAFGRARQKWLSYVNTGGWAPTGFPKHPLTSVSEFKESLGGSKSEQYGSYDIVMNTFLYTLFKFYFRLRW